MSTPDTGQAGPAAIGTATVVGTEVDRPAAEVFAYATDPTRFSQWQAGVVDGHLETAADDDGPGVPVVGTRCLTTRRIGGANRASTSLITHVDPPRTWGVRGIADPIRAIVLPDPHKLSCAPAAGPVSDKTCNATSANSGSILSSPPTERTTSQPCTTRVQHPMPSEVAARHRPGRMASAR